MLLSFNLYARVKRVHKSALRETQRVGLHINPLPHAKDQKYRIHLLVMRDLAHLHDF